MTTTTHRFNILVAFLTGALGLLVLHGRAIETNTCFNVGPFYLSWHVPPSRTRRRTHCILRQPAGRSLCGAEGEEARLPPGRRLSSQQTPRAHPNTGIPASAAPIKNHPTRKALKRQVKSVAGRAETPAESVCSGSIDSSDHLITPEEGAARSCICSAI